MNRIAAETLWNNQALAPLFEVSLKFFFILIFLIDMRYDNKASDCPYDKSDQYENEKHLFLRKWTFEKIDDDNSNPVKGMEKNYAPQSNFQIFEKRRIQESHYGLKFFRSLSQGIDNPYM